LPLVLVVPAACLVPSGPRKAWLYATLQGLVALVPVIAAVAWAWFGAMSPTSGS